MGDNATAMIFSIIALVAAIMAIIAAALGWGAPVQGGSCSRENKILTATELRIGAPNAEWQPSLVFQEVPSIAPSSQLFVENSPENLGAKSSLALSCWFRVPATNVSTPLFSLQPNGVPSDGAHALVLRSDHASVTVTFGSNSSPTLLYLPHTLQPGTWNLALWQVLPGSPTSSVLVAINDAFLGSPVDVTTAPVAQPLLDYTLGSPDGTQDARISYSSSDDDFLIDQSGLDSMWNNGTGIFLPVPRFPDAWYIALGPEENTVPNGGAESTIPDAEVLLPTPWIPGHVPLLVPQEGGAELALNNGAIIGDAYVCSKPSTLRIYLRTAFGSVASLPVPQFTSTFEIRVSFVDSETFQDNQVILPLSLYSTVVDIPLAPNLVSSGQIQVLLIGSGGTIPIAIERLEFI